MVNRIGVAELLNNINQQKTVNSLAERKQTEDERATRVNETLQATDQLLTNDYRQQIAANDRQKNILTAQAQEAAVAGNKAEASRLNALADQLTMKSNLIRQAAGKSFSELTADERWALEMNPNEAYQSSGSYSSSESAARASAREESLMDLNKEVTIKSGKNSTRKVDVAKNSYEGGKSAVTNYYSNAEPSTTVLPYWNGEIYATPDFAGKTLTYNGVEYPINYSLIQQLMRDYPNDSRDSIVRALLQ